MMTVKQRLQLFANKKGLGRNAFEKKCGLTNGILSSKTPNLSSETIEKVKRTYPELDLNWLFTGAENMPNFEQKIETKMELNQPLEMAIVSTENIKEFLLQIRELATENGILKRTIEEYENRMN